MWVSISVFCLRSTRRQGQIFSQPIWNVATNEKKIIRNSKINYEIVRLQATWLAASRYHCGAYAHAFPFSFALKFNDEKTRYLNSAKVFNLRLRRYTNENGIECCAMRTLHWKIELHFGGTWLNWKRSSFCTKFIKLIWLTFNQTDFCVQEFKTLVLDESLSFRYSVKHEKRNGERTQKNHFDASQHHLCTPITQMHRYYFVFMTRLLHSDFVLLSAHSFRTIRSAEKFLSQLEHDSTDDKYLLTFISMRNYA